MYIFPYNASLMVALPSLSRRSEETDAACALMNRGRTRYTTLTAWCNHDNGPRAFDVTCVSLSGRSFINTNGHCPVGTECYQHPATAPNDPDIGCQPARSVHTAESDGDDNPLILVKSPGGIIHMAKPAKKMEFDARTFDAEGKPIQVAEISQYINGHLTATKYQTHVLDVDTFVKDGDNVQFSMYKGAGSKAYVFLQWTAEFI